MKFLAFFLNLSYGQQNSTDIFEWLRERGNFISDSIELRNGPFGRGIYAKNRIEAEEKVIEILSSSLILPDSWFQKWSG